MRNVVLAVTFLAACSSNDSSSPPDTGTTPVDGGADSTSNDATAGDSLPRDGTMVDSTAGDGTIVDSTAGDGSGASMSFFVTSTGNGAMGGNLGGLTGADAKCQSLAAAVGSTRTWHAYLSTSTVDARDRIGSGPWFNVRGVKISDSVDTLHRCDPTGGPGGTELCAPFDYKQALTEKGDIPPPSEHDILTGSDQAGTALTETCANWTSNVDTEFGQVGHFDASDTAGVTHDVIIYIWGGAHASQGCSLDGLKKTGGTGRLYCFAI